MAGYTFNPDQTRSSHISKILFLRQKGTPSKTIATSMPILPQPRSRNDRMLKTTVRPALLIDEIKFLAWVSQANPGDRIEYHRGFMALDTAAVMSRLPPDQQRSLSDLADAAFRAAMKGL